MEANWEMRTLLVDNNQVTLKLIEKTIRVNSIKRCVIHSVKDLANLYKELHLFNPDAVVTTRTSKGFEAYDVLTMVKKHNEYIPVFVVAADKKKINDVFLLQKGAEEIILMPDLASLHSKIRAKFDEKIFELIRY
jgi:hypothetical protein